MSPAIQFDNVSKIYRLGAYRTGLRDLWANRTAQDSSGSHKLLYALNEVSFEIDQGEAVGLIGQNGAGKTTALKLLSRVTTPTSGRLNVSGRLSALIQLGAGFHPDLTGRDNVYLNGTILGLSRAEIRQRFDEIVAFADLEQFIDTPVKRYSSGMYARLGFAVAVHVAPDVLLVDEVLAVGDTAFQFKCFRKIREFVDSGKTVVFVSHNLDAVQGLCQRVLWLDHGQLRLDGAPAEVISAYLQNQEEHFLKAGGKVTQTTQGPLHIERVVLRKQSGQESYEYDSGEDITVEFHYRADGIVKAPYFSVGVSDQGSGVLFLATMLLEDWARTDLVGRGVISCCFTGVSLMPKAYQIWGSVRDEHGFSDLVAWQPLCPFRVVTPPAPIAAHAEQLSIVHLKSDAPIYVDHEWRLEPFSSVIGEDA